MKIEKSIAEILMNDWNPIGVKDNLNAKTEYDSYALRITGMIYNGSSEDQVADYLNQVLKDELGLSVNENLSKIVSKKIFSLKIERPYRK